jgi:hypothetical protein
MQPNKPENTGALSVDHLNHTALNAVEVICSVASMPIAMLLRPWFGTRVFPPPVCFLAAMMMIALPVASALIDAVSGMIPFFHASPSIGLFDIASLSKLFFISGIVHSVRLYRRMIHMHLEENSTYEGRALPFFRFIPWTNSFWLTRCAIEPIFVVIAATILQDLFIFQPGLATFLRISAVALAMRNFVAWYRTWEYLRNLLDARNAGPILARLVENDASEEELSTIHLASFPSDVSPEIRSQAAASIARAYSPNN